MPDYGIVSLVPTAVVLALAIWSHRTIESVIAGAMVAFLITSGSGFLSAFSEANNAIGMTAYVIRTVAP